jgi:hypothetical protein
MDHPDPGSGWSGLTAPLLPLTRTGPTGFELPLTTGDVTNGTSKTFLFGDRQIPENELGLQGTKANGLPYLDRLLPCRAA